MHATVRSGGRSPKPVNSPAVSSQSKSGSDSVQNNATSFSSHNKRRKRDHGDQGPEPAKRERSSKTVDGGDNVKLKTESTLKSDIANITKRGGLVNTEGVKKLLQLMQSDKSGRKMDLISRSMLAGVIAMTDKFDCLSQFVQFKGLSVFDEWLQDIHKGKIGDSNSSNEADKSVEDFLLVLLRALDKLPVNLHALQTCNIGRSVNHLRTQKSVDIQRKARGLVDTWKKRVEAEMNVVDSKPGAPQATVPKNSDAQISASKSTSLKPFQGECGTKSASSSPGAMKSSALSQGSGKDGQHRISVGSASASDLPSTPAREEKSSSSSQSHNYSQSLSGREDARSSTAGSMCAKKISGSSTSRHRKSSNGFPGPTVAGIQKETGSNKTISLHKGSSSERASGLTCEKTVDVVPAGETRSHKLIVKIRNRGRSPAQSATEGLCDDTSIMNSRASSPVLSDKPEQLVRNMKEPNDVNTESWQSNDFKDVVTGSDEGDVSPDAIRDENRSRAVTVDDSRKAAEVVKASLSSGNLQEASFNSINVLIESSVKCCEGNTSLSVGDDVGMNLLASVATGEISTKSDSPQRDILEKVSDQLEEKKEATITGCEEDSKLKGNSDLLADNKANGVIVNMDEDEKQTLEVQSSHSSFEQRDNKKDVNKSLGKGVHFEQKQLVASVLTKDIDHTDKKAMHSSATDKDLLNEDNVEFNVRKADGMESRVSTNQTGGGGPVHNTKDTHIIETRESVSVGPAVPDQNSECMKEDVGSKEAHDKCSTEVVSHKAPPAFSSQEKEQQVVGFATDEKDKRTAANASNSTLGTSDVDMKPKFDLNEGFNVDDGNFGGINIPASVQHSTARRVDLPPFPVSGVSNSLPASITVTAAAKGAFVPPEDLMKNRRELGWKGSAATSAFRPAEPRKCLEMPLGLTSLPLPDNTGNRNERPVFDFDLNVADERVLEDVSTEESISRAVPLSALKINHDFAQKDQPSCPPTRASGGFDLDLNRVDDANEVAQLTGSKYRLDPSLLPMKSTSSSGLPHSEMQRGFDLNNGPVLDDRVESVSSNQHGRGSVQLQLPAGGIRMNGADLGNFSAWFHPGSTYSPVPVPSIFHDRGDKPFPIVPNQRIVGPPSGCTQDIYRGSVLSSSPAMPFPSTSFQYPVFPFVPTFPVASANLSGVPTPYMDPASGGRISYPGVNSQLLGHGHGHAASVSSHSQRPYMVGLADVGSNGGTESSRKFGWQGLDLNAGPGGLDMERKDETLPSASRQFMVAGSQGLSEEQARMHQLVGGALKRKESEGSLDADNFRFRQFPWQ